MFTGVIDDDIYDDGIIDDENHDEELFQIQSGENDKKFVLVNTRIDYQYRSANLNNTCVYDFVSTLYKKKMNTTDVKYLSNIAEPVQETNQRGRPPNIRYPFLEQHPQAVTHLLMKYSEDHVPILYGPQIPRRDRDDTRERYSRALLTLFVPWRVVTDVCDINQTWEDAFHSRQNRISIHSWKIIENIQLLHECKKDRDEHLLKVIAEAQTENDEIDPALLPANRDINGECDVNENDDLLELIGSLGEYTTIGINTTKKSTENQYIEETIETVENVGRFTPMNRECNFQIVHKIENNGKNFVLAIRQFPVNKSIDLTNRQLTPFVPATPNLVQLNKRWQEQLKSEKERIRRGLVTGNYTERDDTLDLNSQKDPLVTVLNSNAYDKNMFENYGSILPVASITSSFPTQKSVADQFTLNKEQRAAFMIITSHLDDDGRYRTGNPVVQSTISQKIRFFR